MVEVSTDKVDAEVPAAGGTVAKILVQPDETIEVGKPLAEIDPNGAPRGARQGRGRGTSASERAPAARRLRRGPRGLEAAGRSGGGRGGGPRDRDAGDGRVGHRGDRARVARARRATRSRRADGRRGLDRQGRRRGPAPASGTITRINVGSRRDDRGRQAAGRDDQGAAGAAAVQEAHSPARRRSRRRHPRPSRGARRATAHAPPRSRAAPPANGVSLGAVRGTGAGGKITKADVLAAEGTATARRPTQPPPSAAEGEVKPLRGPGGDARQGDGGEPLDPDRDLVPHARRRHARRQAQGAQRRCSRSAG